MITELKIENFKAFQKPEVITLTPLTIIAGKNSSGKSSILHALLLLKQTIIAEGRQEAVTLEGTYLQYSQLRELTFSLPQLGACAVRFYFKVKRGNKTGIVDFELRHKALPQDAERRGIVVNYFSCYPDIPADAKLDSFIEGNSESQDTKLELKLRNGKYLWPSNYPFSPSPPANFKSTGPATVKFDGFLPVRVTKRFSVKENDGKSRIDEFQLPLAAVAREIELIISRLRTDFKSLRYLGPVRALPKRAYVHYTSHYDLEHDGSNAAQVLWLRQKEMVKWGSEKKPLLHVVNECLQMIGLTQKVSAKQFRRIIYQLHVQTLSDSKKTVTIADVGFGFSQLLPVILRGLLPPDGLIIFEQPEIHLHPACAARLADLFFYFVASGKQVVVETHSAELINRMRLLVVENPSRAKNVNIVFVSPPSERGTGSTIRQMTVDKNGMPGEWPEGFCDESANLAEAIILARHNERLKK